MSADWITKMHVAPVSVKYRDLGNLSAVDPSSQVSLDCHKCRVKWIGCFDANVCPECGDWEAWEELMEFRGHYTIVGSREEF